MKVKTETLKFIPITKIVPERWSGWFYDMLSSNAPFTWGDNNRSLITATRLADHAESVFEGAGDDYDEKETDKWLAEVRKLGETLIDLEN